jgi:predicted AlkP superfamily pyrophosphatase or phosphodiesterase
MVDPKVGRFTTTDTIGNRDPRWWGGEPIWVTAIKQGRRAATMFWVGSEGAIQGIRPTYWRPFDPPVSATARVDQVLEWLSLPLEQRPDLVTLYFNRVDLMGHRRGPASAAVDSAIGETDGAIGRLVDSLRGRGVFDRTNLLIVSDHGMTAISPDRVIYLDDYVSIDPSEITDLAPATAIDPGPGRAERIYQGLVNAHPNLRVYRREEVPARFHFRTNSRIAPILALADDGWTISTRQRWRVSPLTDLGNHGYDNALTSMAATFIATGPAFRTGVVVPPFQSIHLYELMAYLMGLRPATNDGALDSVRTVLR